jgi:hypothetical protein
MRFTRIKTDATQNAIFFFIAIRLMLNKTHQIAHAHGFD